ASEGFVFFVAALSVLPPIGSPVTNPSSACRPVSGWNAPVTSALFRVTCTFCSATVAGTSTRTSALPPLTRSAPVESVVITSGGGAAYADMATARSATAARLVGRNLASLMSDLLVVKGSDTRCGPGWASADVSTRNARVDEPDMHPSDATPATITCQNCVSNNVDPRIKPIAQTGGAMHGPPPRKWHGLDMVWIPL